MKVSGKAKYTSDFHFPGLLYAVPVEATIANGRVVKLDTAAAAKMPGVRAIFQRGNIGKIFRSVPELGLEGICEERRPPSEDDVVRYYGQYIALAVADTFETAKAAADAVRVTYDKEKPNVATHLEADDEPDQVVTTFGMRHRPAPMFRLARPNVRLKDFRRTESCGKRLKALLTWLKKNDDAHKHRDHDVSRAALVVAFRRDRSRHAFGGAVRFTGERHHP